MRTLKKWNSLLQKHADTKISISVSTPIYFALLAIGIWIMWSLGPDPLVH